MSRYSENRPQRIERCEDLLRLSKAYFCTALIPRGHCSVKKNWNSRSAVSYRNVRRHSSLAHPTRLSRLLRKRKKYTWAIFESDIVER